MDRYRSPAILLAAGFALAACTGRGAPSAASVTPLRYHEVTPEQLAAMLDQKDFFFVNTHVPYEGEINGTDAFVPYDQIGQNLGQFPADRQAKIVLYCRSGRMSEIAANVLVELGYSDVWNLEGGMLAWERAGLPLVER